MKVLAWIWAALCVVLAVGTFIGGAWIAAIMFLIVAIVAVPTEKNNAEYAAKGVTKKHRVIGSITLFTGALIATLMQSPTKHKAEKLNTSAPEPTAAQTAGLDKKSLASLFSVIQKEVEVCDATLGLLDPKNGGGKLSQFEIYEIAKSASERCKAAWLAIDEIDIPDMSSDAEERAEKAKKDCSTAYFYRLKSAEILMEIANGDGSPATLSELRESSETYNNRLALCVSELS